MVEAIRARGGAVTFRDFMAIALYDPEHGYYSSAEPRYGRSGDFLTAPTASPWYARVVGRFMRDLSAEAGSVAVVDVAAGDGAFLGELDAALGDGRRQVVDSLWAVERSPAMRARIGASVPRASVVAHIDELPRDLGRPAVLHACELYDAFPVHRVEGGSTGPWEQWVVEEGDGLRIEGRPPLPAVRAYLADHRIALAEGQVAELNLEARASHRRLLEGAGEGLALVLDYGYETRRLYRARGRRAGSLATYRRHRLGRDPLESPGEVDLTSHVNWDDLRLAATDAGWVEIGLWPLAEFLVRAGLAAELDERGLGMAADLDAATLTARQEVKRLLDPEGMGSDLKVLLQARGPLVGIAAGLLPGR
jgi:SAM-dependent MidA family methyltransferase